MRGGAAAWSWAGPALRTQLPCKGSARLIWVPTGHLRVSSGAGSNPSLGVISETEFSQASGPELQELLESQKLLSSRQPLPQLQQSLNALPPSFLFPCLSFLFLPSLLLSFPLS